MALTADSRSSSTTQVSSLEVTNVHCVYWQRRNSVLFSMQLSLVNSIMGLEDKWFLWQRKVLFLCVREYVIETWKLSSLICQNEKQTNKNPTQQPTTPTKKTIQMCCIISYVCLNWLLLIGVITGKIVICLWLLSTSVYPCMWV